MNCTREELKEALKMFASHYNGSDEDLRAALLDVGSLVSDLVKCEIVHYSERSQAELVLEAFEELITNRHIIFKKDVTNKETPMKESTITVKPLTESTFKPLEITLQINKEEDLLAMLAALLPSVQEVEEIVRGSLSLSVSQKKTLIEGNNNSNLPYQLFSDLEDYYPLADL